MSPGYRAGLRELCLLLGMFSGSYRLSRRLGDSCPASLTNCVHSGLATAGFASCQKLELQSRPQPRRISEASPFPMDSLPQPPADDDLQVQECTQYLDWR